MINIEMKTIEEINQHNVKKILSEKKIPEFFPGCLLYTSPSPRDRQKSRMPSSA